MEETPGQGGGSFFPSHFLVEASTQPRAVFLHPQISSTDSWSKTFLKRAAETEKLAKENWILKNQIKSMTLDTEYAKSNALNRERQLRKEVKEITLFATSGTVPLASYRALFDTIHE